MIELIQLEGMVNQHRWWTWITGNIDPTLCFLLDAIRISGFYDLLRKHIKPLSLGQKDPTPNRASSNKLFNQWCEENVSSLPHNPEQIAFWLDFSDAEDFMTVLDAKFSEALGLSLEDGRKAAQSEY